MQRRTMMKTIAGVLTLGLLGEAALGKVREATLEPTTSLPPDGTRKFYLVVRDDAQEFPLEYKEIAFEDIRKGHQFILKDNGVMMYECEFEALADADPIGEFGQGSLRALPVGGVVHAAPLQPSLVGEHTCELTWPTGARYR